MPEISPYHRPGFYDEALARGRHRDIVGGRWSETGSLHLHLLQDAGLRPHHHLLDSGAGSLRQALPVYESRLPFHQRVLAAGLAHSLGQSLRLAGVLELGYQAARVRLAGKVSRAE